MISPSDPRKWEQLWRWPNRRCPACCLLWKGGNLGGNTSTGKQGCPRQCQGAPWVLHPGGFSGAGEQGLGQSHLQHPWSRAAGCGWMLSHCPCRKWPVPALGSKQPTLQGFSGQKIPELNISLMCDSFSERSWGVWQGMLCFLCHALVVPVFLPWVTLAGA